MKKSYLLPFAVCLLIGSLFLIPFGCSKDPVKSGFQKITLLKPVYKAKAEVLQEINGNPAQAIENAGKIYIKDQYIFLNEVDKGIHIIDNSDPAKPVQVAFLNIPGNEDIAVKGNTLYADMYSSLLAIDITDPRHTSVSKVVNHIFIDRSNINGFMPDSNLVAVDWIKKDTVVALNSYPLYPDCANCLYAASNATPSANAAGVAGSMAKMVLINNYLYAITERHSLGIIDVTDNAAPSFVSSMVAGYDLETIYPFKDKLFLGSAIGMFMYDVSDPLQPAALGEFKHGQACDPVITDGDYAYVTLHAGSSCGGSSNELDVINIKNMQQSQLVKTYAMTKPTGLCKDGSLLFVCDGSAGLKLYDASNPGNLKLIKQLTFDNEPYDVIAYNHTALVVTAKGMYQYDYSNFKNIYELSFIATK